MIDPWRVLVIIHCHAVLDNYTIHDLEEEEEEKRWPKRKKRKEKSWEAEKKVGMKRRER